MTKLRHAEGDVAETLARPDLHQEWISRFRQPHVFRFTAHGLGIAVRKLGLVSGSEVLDAGCGSGTNSLWLARQGFRVTGVDFSDFALGEAEEMARVEGLGDWVAFAHADLTRLPFAHASFDAVFCIGVLMHIPKLEEALGELARVTRPGGALIIVESNASALETSLFRAYWKIRRPEIRVERKECGLEVWSETSAGPLLSRKLSIEWLTHFLRERGVKRVLRLTGELSELYIYVRSPLLRKLVHASNEAWLKIRGRASLAASNILAFRKER